MLARGLRRLRDGLISLAYPADCLVCGEAVESWDDGVACAQCWSNPSVTRPFIQDGLCLKCGIPVFSFSHLGKIPLLDFQAGQSAPKCGLCSEMPFNAARACGAYTGAIEVSILFLKSHPHLCHRLRELIARAYSASRDALKGDLIVPMPLHRLREKERGFNQAYELARTLARHSGLPIARRSLTRVKNTARHRFGMDAQDRSKSVAAAFAAPDPQSVRGADVLIVDDLFTTGSTISAASLTLLEAGAKGVTVLTIGRVI